MTTLAHRGTGRSWRAVGAVAAVWAVLAAGYVWLDAEGWIVAGLAAFTLPAVLEIVTARHASLDLNGTGIRWQSERHSETLLLQDIAHVRLDRRWDGTVRASLVERSGRHHAIPPEATPPHQRFESALTAAGIVVQRHPFSLFR